MANKSTRLPADLLAAAEAEGRKQNRSTSKQIEHWARLGKYFDHQTGEARRRILRAVVGEAPLEELEEYERIVANALITATISAAANEASFVDRPAPTDPTP